MPKLSAVTDGANTTSNKAKPREVKREIRYAEETVEICSGETAITADDAKELLGWEEETAENRFGNDFLFKLNGVKIRCHNNVTNRTIYPSVFKMLKQEILRKRWCGPNGSGGTTNGEAIIVGQTGQILNGQHTLIAVILAVQEWAANKEQWGSYWATEPVIDKPVHCGVDECDSVVNTMDTCKSRSLTDVIGRSEYFKDLPQRERHACSKILEYAVRLLWHRTGAGVDAYSPRRTHAESLDFIARHSKVLDCVKHIYAEDGDDAKIGHLINAGSAAGLLYLMGSSATNPLETPYRSAQLPEESMLDFSSWDQACDFWVTVKDNKAVKRAIDKCKETGGNPKERQAIFAKAWLLHAQGKPITEKALEYTVTVAEGGGRILDECPTVGGIDLGEPEKTDEMNIATIGSKKDPTKEEIKDRARAIKKGEVQIAAKAGEKWAAGDKAWVYSADGEHYFGTLSKPYKISNGHMMTEVTTADGNVGNVWETDLIDLRLEQPTGRAPASKPKFPKTKPTEHAKLKPTEYKIGSPFWVREAGEIWRGRLLEVNNKLQVARISVDQGFKGATTVKTIPLADLSVQQPDVA